MALNVDDVRRYMLDFPELNRLWDYKVVFTDDQISTALDWSVENFNSEPPLHIRIASQYDVPSNSLLLMGAVKYLLQSLILMMQRNHLTYSDGGLSINVSDQHLSITPFVQNLNMEYKDLLARTKAFININGTYGATRSQWPVASPSSDSVGASG